MILIIIGADLGLMTNLNIIIQKPLALYQSPVQLVTALLKSGSSNDPLVTDLKVARKSIVYNGDLSRLGILLYWNY